MSSPSAPAARQLVDDILGQPWVADLVTELAERQRRSAELAAQVRELSVTNDVFLPFHAPPFPLVVTEARGSRLLDVDGNSYLDLHLGFGGQSLWGHNPPRVVEFVREQLAGSTGNGYLNPIELDLVRLMRELVPHCEKFAFLNSGTDATNAAIRLARAHTGRRLVAKFEGCWHGVHDVAAHNTAFMAHGHPLIQPFPEIGENGIPRMPAFAGVAPGEVLVLPHRIEAAIDLIDRNRDQLACVIADPACQSYPFLDQTIPEVKAVSERCAQLGVPFILDEVLTGFRFGPAGAAGHFGIRADLYTYGKVVSGLGIPLSAVGGRAELLDRLLTSGLPLTDIGRKTFAGNTHSGSQLALAASYASLSLLREAGDAYYERTRAKVAKVQQRLAAFREETRIPLRLLGFGDFAGTVGFIAEDSYDDYRRFAAAVNPIGLFLLTLMLRRRGVYTLSLPMFYTGDAHSDADIDELCRAVTESALELDKHGFPFILP